MRNDIAFQSQQFAEQVAQRRDKYSQQRINSMQQIPQAAQSFINNYQNAQNQQMQAQEHQVNMAKAASSLASDELHRQQAQEELQWAQQLHQSDMLAMQKDAMAQDLALKKAQTEKAIGDLNGSRDYLFAINENERDTLTADQGLIVDGHGKNFRIRKATDDERKMASRRLDQRFQRALQMKAAGRGASRDPALQQLTDLTRERDRVQRIIASLQFDRMSSQDQQQIQSEFADLNQQISAHYQRTNPNFGKKPGGAEGAMQEFASTTAGQDILSGLNELFGGSK